MIDTQQVIPDSQDEAEIGGFELDRLSASPEPQPLSNPSLHSLNPSSSFSFSQTVLCPKSKPITGTSIISQFTIDSTQTARTEDISKFTELSVDLPQPLNVAEFLPVALPSHPVASKPRPRPRPKFANKGNKERGANGDKQDASSIVHSPIVASTETAFSIDIPERVKMGHSRGGNASNMEGESVVEKRKDVILLLDDDENPSLSGTKQAFTFPSPSPGKRKKGVEALLEANNVINISNQVDMVGKDITGPMRKKKTKVVYSDDDTSTENPKKDTKAMDRDKYDRLSEKSKEKKKPKPATEGKSRSNPEKLRKTKKKSKCQSIDPSLKPSIDDVEQQQFKSREFIFDSDDELRLVDKDGPLTAVSPMIHNPGTQRISSLDLDRMSPLSSLSDDEEEKIAKSTAASTFSEKRVDKGKEKKRKSVDNHEDNGLTSKNSDDRPLTKKVKRNKKSSKPGDKDTVSVPESVMRAMDTGKRVASDSESECPIVVKKKKGRRAVVDDDDNDNDDSIDPQKVKEDSPPTLKAKPTNAPLPAKPLEISKPKLLSRSSLPHPPKNRPLATVLQRVNSASPRPRASPAVARSFLTRIAPLHPNRRTPPPPPPRIIPKKTKKELAREEKWEEELQDTVPGWCELDESERDRLRKQKRDWELGLIED